MALTPVAWCDQTSLADARRSASVAVQRVAGLATLSNLVTRDLRPTDVNNGTAIAAFSNGAQWTANTLMNDVFARPLFSLSATQGLAIFGITLLSTNPALREMQFGIPAGLYDILELGVLLGEQRPTGIIDPPVFYKPNEHVVINALTAVTVAAGVEEFAILGVLAEQSDSNVLAQRNVVPS